MKNRTVLKYHSYTGLLVGVFLFIMGISGAILVFQHDIEDKLWKEYIHVQSKGEPKIDKGIRTVQNTYPDWDTRLIHFEPDEALIFNLRKPDQRLFVFVHPTSGEIIKEINELTTFTRWLLKFHYSLQAGVVGRMIVFVVGILFFISLLTGAYLYRKSILKTLLFRTKVNNTTKRTFYSSLHRIVGVWALIFNLLLVITGIFLSYSVVAASLKDPVMPNTPTVTASMEKVLRKITTDNPDFDPTYIRLPSNDRGNALVYGFYNNDPFYFSEFINVFQVDYHSGEIVNIQKAQEVDLLTQLSGSLLPLHFGNYGGIWTKILYSLVGLSGPFLSISGFFIWRKSNSFKKRKF